MASVRQVLTKAGQSTWQVRFRHAGKQTSRTFLAKTDATRWAKRVEIDGPAAALAWLDGEDEQEPGITVHELATRFLAHKGRDVTPRTHADYTRNFTNWIDPWFGAREAATVTEREVQEWVDHVATQRAPKTVADVHMLLHSIYAYGRARSRAFVDHNPCLETELPKRRRTPPKGTTVAEWRAILDAAEKRNPDAHDLILFLGSIGWRWSEAAALAVRDVHDDGTTVWVDVTRVFRMIEHRQVLVEDAAKSYAGFRRAPLPTEAATMVRRRIAGKKPTDFVFTNTRGNHWNQVTFLRDTWPAIVKDAGVKTPGRKPTPHWLRHMAVGVMAAAGIPMHEIQRAIGHENITTTNKTYGGMVSGITPAGVAAIDAVLASSKVTNKSP